MKKSCGLISFLAFVAIPVQAETLIIGQQQSQITVTIPEAARSGYPIVSASGISGIEGSPDTSYLSLIAKDINLNHIRSVVEGINSHYIYVGYYSDNDNTIGNIASIDLYKINPVVIQIDSGTGLQPYLTRMISTGTYSGEICYVKNGVDDVKPDIYCNVDGISEFYRVAHVHDSGFDQNINVKAIDATQDGLHFLIADGISKKIIYVKRNNASPIVSDFGNRGAAGFNFFPVRTGLAAYLNASYQPAAYLTTQADNQKPSDADCPDSGTANDSCLWQLTMDSNNEVAFFQGTKITDTEIDRRISTLSSIYLYLIVGSGNAAGISTLAEDPIHDIRGFVDAHDLDNDGENESIYLSRNTTSYIKLASNPQKPINNQNEIIISTSPELIQKSVGYPNAEQDEPLYVKVTLRGWKGRTYYVRVIDPSDLSGYAPAVANPDAGNECIPGTADPPGPFMNACDNRVWSDAIYKTQFGLCLSKASCDTPAKMMAVSIPTSTNDKTFYLKMPKRYSGDNILVQASELPFGDLNAKVAVDAFSGIYTGWKRVFYEQDFMFRHGGLLYNDFDKDNCIPGDTCRKIKVFDWSDIEVNDEIVIFTEPDENVYLSSEDSNNIIPPKAKNCIKANLLPGSNCDVAKVVNISAPQNGFKEITLDKDLTNNYYAAKTIEGKNNIPRFFNIENNQISIGHSAGFGVLSRAGQAYDCDLSTASKTCFYNADISDLPESFNDGFTFAKSREDGSGALPYLPQLVFAYEEKWRDANRISFNKIWFHNCLRGVSNKCYANNYFHLIGVSKYNNLLAGMSIRINTYMSLIFVEFIESLSKPAEILIHTTNHELLHLFAVNPCECDFHNDLDAWCSTLQGCGNPNYNNVEWSIMHVGRCVPGDEACQNEDYSMQSDGIEKLDTFSLIQGILQECNILCDDGTVRHAFPGDGTIRYIHEPI